MLVAQQGERRHECEQQDSEDDGSERSHYDAPVSMFHSIVRSHGIDSTPTQLRIRA